MFKNLKKRTEGFTIIEVLIVLAIAGLILLIVFLAVPALQRNSRNTQRRDDVQKMLGVLQEATNNNGGTLPLPPAPTVLTAERYSQYALPADLTYNVVAPTAAATAPAGILLTQVQIYNKYKCGTTPAAQTGPSTTALVPAVSGTQNTTLTTLGATARTIVMVFAVEIQSGQMQLQCVES